MNMRNLKRWLRAVLFFAVVAQLSAVGVVSAAVVTRVFTDSAGRDVTIPQTVDTLVPSGPLAQIVLYTLVDGTLGERLETACRRIGMAKLSAAYWVIGLGSGKPQSQAGPRRAARDAQRWIAHMAIADDITMKTKTRMPE